uniref:Uncharacterized protein n=1 Tax=Timema bartmani TaxID=61472 RepID=A0A7R9HW84_9NEOP|nr:unnamed protein product [Timema bartmani]
MSNDSQREPIENVCLRVGHCKQLPISYFRETQRAAPQRRMALVRVRCKRPKQSARWIYFNSANSFTRLDTALSIVFLPMVYPKQARIQGGGRARGANKTRMKIGVYNTRLCKVVEVDANCAGAAIVAGHQAASTSNQHSGSRDPLALPPGGGGGGGQVITLSQLHNYLPAAAPAPDNQQGHPVKTYVSSAGTPTVVSLQGLPGQFLQDLRSVIRRLNHMMWQEKEGGNGVFRGSEI